MADLKKLMIAALKQQLKTEKPVHLPAGGALLWTWFNELSRARTMHAAGPNALSFQDIHAYVAVRRLEFGQHHIDILLAMDHAYLEHFRAANERPPEGVRTLPAVSNRSISAGLFDAMMG